MLVQQHEVHLILGPDHRDQRMIQQSTNCYIVVPKRATRANNMREVYLIGTPDARARARDLIRAHIGDRDFSGRVGPASVSKVMEVPPEVMRYIIGKGLSFWNCNAWEKADFSTSSGEYTRTDQDRHWMQNMVPAYSSAKIWRLNDTENILGWIRSSCGSRGMCYWGYHEGMSPQQNPLLAKDTV